jgi:Crp-like helix-turn-helix protein
MYGGVAGEAGRPVPLCRFDGMLSAIKHPATVVYQFSLWPFSQVAGPICLNTLASIDTVHRLVRVLLRLGSQLGHTSGQRTELSAYLTQEEISQIVVARRERVSTAMNFLRNRGWSITPIGVIWFSGGAKQSCPRHRAGELSGDSVASLLAPESLCAAQASTGTEYRVTMAESGPPQASEI